MGWEITHQKGMNTISHAMSWNPQKERFEAYCPCNGILYSISAVEIQKEAGAKLYQERIRKRK